MLFLICIWRYVTWFWFYSQFRGIVDRQMYGGLRSEGVSKRPFIYPPGITPQWLFLCEDVKENLLGIVIVTLQLSASELEYQESEGRTGQGHLVWGKTSSQLVLTQFLSRLD